MVEPSGVFVCGSEVPQVIPLTDTVAPPFETIVPPLVAEVWVMFVADDVEQVGTTTVFPHAGVLQDWV